MAQIRQRKGEQEGEDLTAGHTALGFQKQIWVLNSYDLVTVDCYFHRLI